MAFKDLFNNSNQEDNSEKKSVNWDALHEYTVKTCDLEEEDVLIGRISGMVYLGLHDLEDGRMEWDGSPEDEEAEIEKHPGTWFEDGTNDKGVACRFKMWKQKPAHMITYAVDFPQIQLNKGQFFDESCTETRPLRIYLGGSFYTKEQGMVVARPIRLSVKNIGDNGKKVWSAAKNSVLYKMASGAKLIAEDGSFHPSRAQELVGKSLQFSVRVFFKQGKDGKKYFTESIKYASGLGRSMQPVETGIEEFSVVFDEINKAESLSELRGHILNTIRSANNFKGSLLEKQLAEVRPSQDNAPAKEDPPAKEESSKKTPPKPVQQKPKKVEAPAEDDFDPDIPF